MELVILILKHEKIMKIILNRIKNDSEILHWVKHLCGKTWMTTWKLQQFISNMEQYNKTLKESEEVECLS